MSWFQLDSESVVARVRASGRPPEIPCLGTSLQRGIVGFTLLSIAGFAPWAVLGKWFYRNIGEGGLYAGQSRQPMNTATIETTTAKFTSR